MGSKTNLLPEVLPQISGPSEGEEEVSSCGGGEAGGRLASRFVCWIMVADWKERKEKKGQKEEEDIPTREERAEGE